jgi:hypothetical protein
LVTPPIDLTNAKEASLEFYLKFNIKISSTAPIEDCIQVLITTDNGATWEKVNFDVRACWGVSSTLPDTYGGDPLDGKSPSGLSAFPEASDDSVRCWVSSATLSYLSANITGWVGHVIKIRIRVLTNTDGFEYEQLTSWGGGVYIDNFKVSGTSIPPPATRSSERSGGEPEIEQLHGKYGENCAKRHTSSSQPFFNILLMIILLAALIVALAAAMLLKKLRKKLKKQTLYKLVG